MGFCNCKVASCMMTFRSSSISTPRTGVTVGVEEEEEEGVVVAAAALLSQVTGVSKRDSIVDSKAKRRMAGARSTAMEPASLPLPSFLSWSARSLARPRSLLRNTVCWLFSSSWEEKQGVMATRISRQRRWLEVEKKLWLEMLPKSISKLLQPMPRSGVTSGDSPSKREAAADESETSTKSRIANHKRQIPLRSLTHFSK
mmetsp:Transcript_21284/g.38046  ORF Transcript_21284/g.38046 Transcript_21284/m.38046 type:complete len:200 (+) Transcript_21284:1458-2057(+)